MFRKTFQHILFLTLFAIIAINAQVVDSSFVVDSTEILNEIDLIEGDKPLLRYENGIKVTYENGIKLVGEKTFVVGLDKGRLYLMDMKLGGTRGYNNFEIDIKKTLEGMKIPNASNKDLKQIIFTNSARNQNPSAYIVLNNAILLVKIYSDKDIRTSNTFPKDGSNIFLHDGGIYVAPNSTIVATTPTTLLVIRPNDVLSVTYESLFGKIPLFKKPTISGGRNPDEAFIRDETMRNDTNAVRLELDLKTLDITVKKDID